MFPLFQSLIPDWHKFLLTLLVLRTGAPYPIIALLFGMTKATVSKIFTTWISVMYQVR